MNGALGTVRHIVFAQGEYAPVHQPRAIIVEMDTPYEGPSIPGLGDRFVAINAQTNFIVKRQCLERTQFPLTLAFGLTIHKSQAKFSCYSLLQLNKYTNFCYSIYRHDIEKGPDRRGRERAEQGADICCPESS